MKEQRSGEEGQSVGSTSQARSVRSNREKTYRIALIAMFTALTAIGAFIRIPLPVIPFTLQLFFTTMAGLLLGGELGALAVGMYIVLGLLGVPVFTGGGGFSYIFQPSFGYILGFAGGSWVTGKLSSGTRPGFFRVLGACLAGLAVIYVMGLVYCYLIYSLYLKEPMAIGTLLLNGFIMTLPADILKMLLAATVGQRLIPVLRK